jgi:molecular chaperone DnaJ
MNDDDDAGNLYDRLGVESDATDADITSAYRRLAREHHPDTNRGGPRQAFTELTDAYDVLRDPARRRAYDDARRVRADAATAAAGGVRIPVRHVTTSGGGAGERARQVARPGRAPEVELPLTFEQAALGTTAVLAIEADDPCGACRGNGLTTAGATPCATCGATGSTTRRSGGITIRAECAACGGSGRGRPDACPECAGAGHRRQTIEVGVRVPAGVDTGTRLRIPVPGGTEVIGVVRVSPHPYFTRNGNDLHLRVPVTVAEAMLGGVITVPTLDDAVAIRLPAGTPHGRTLRVRGKGVPHPEGTGDLLATVDVVIATDLNPAQRAALEAFAAATESPRRHLEARHG